MSAEPAYDGYFADPFLLATEGGYVAYGSSEPFTGSGGAFQALTSPDLRTWRSAGTVLTVDATIGTDVWAPEVLHAENAWWMYYSAGFGIADHHLRVATASSPLGPFVDCGVDLTPDESFAIDPHPFVDADGSRFLFYARDVLDADRPGTHLAMRRMRSFTELDADAVAVLAPNADWQRYERNRSMYGRTLDWYTLEGPTVVRRNGRYALLYSGGSWEGPDYGVSYAVADSLSGPWSHASEDVPLVLSTALTGQAGPGHNSVLRLQDDSFVTAYHSWDAERTRRRMHISTLTWDGTRPLVADAGSRMAKRPAPQ